MRPTKREYYLEIAGVVANRGTCLRRNYGAVIVNNDRIVATGYTGVSRGSQHCVICPREAQAIPSGERYDMCRSIHAEVNAIIHAGRDRAFDSTMYVVGIEGHTILSVLPCIACMRVIQNAGIKLVITYEHELLVASYKEVNYE